MGMSLTLISVLRMSCKTRLEARYQCHPVSGAKNRLFGPCGGVREVAVGHIAGGAVNQPRCREIASTKIAFKKVKKSVVRGPGLGQIM